jgi:hypothetical protein
VSQSKVLECQLALSLEVRKKGSEEAWDHSEHRCSAWPWLREFFKYFNSEEFMVATAIISGGTGTADEKIEALQSAGARVAKTPAEMAATLKSML